MIHCTGFQAVSLFDQWDPLNSDMGEGLLCVNTV